MSNYDISSASRSTPIELNKVLKDTYRLLALTLLFSAFTATVSIMMHVPSIVAIVCSIGAIGILWFVLPKYANSAKGLPLVFVVTGLLGFGLGPMLSSYLMLENGPKIIATALGGTGVIFLSLSVYALITKKNFNFMGGFLMVGFVVCIIAAIANIFLHIPALSLAISSAIVMIMSGFILYDTSQMIRGEQTNYIIMTISLYLNILNIFTSLLSILGIMDD